ncbi:MAG: endonuclease/exonuclease/phosphatase family protein [Flavobacterium sp.]
MKIITWNCNMAYRKKAGHILAHKPDIVVVPECEHPDKLRFNDDITKPTDVLWFGENKNKGLGIFSYSHFRFKLIRTHNPAFKMIIPIAVSGNDYKFTLFAVWANNPADPDGVYVEQVWKALHHYKLSKKNTILAGDFNSNTIWDRKYRIGNHSHVVDHLQKKGITSCYHLHHNQLQGREEHPTHYLYRHRDKPYHLDYCFASADLACKIESVEIGDFDFWKQYSDHVPVIVNFHDD